ncbi:hypothetical protein ACFQ1S_40360, partial [Kibdelosporangium lantanae]
MPKQLLDAAQVRAALTLVASTSGRLRVGWRWWTGSWPLCVPGCGCRRRRTRCKSSSTNNGAFSIGLANETGNSVAVQLSAFHFQATEHNTEF